MKKALLGLPLFLVVLLVALCGLPFCATCGDHDEAVTELVLACPRAVELIGDDAHPAKVGMACGSTEVSGSSGNATWSMAYTGNRGRGDVSWEAIKRQDQWSVQAATLEIDDEVIDLVHCVRGNAKGPGPGRVLAQTNADAIQGDFEGKVIRSTHTAIVVGSVCKGTIARERGSPSGTVAVRCTGGAAEASNDILAYDGRGNFSLDVADASRREDDRAEYDDAKTTDQDGTPGCRISASAGKGTLTLWDAGYEIVVEL
jgi:hypothetical protein